MLVGYNSQTGTTIMHVVTNHATIFIMDLQRNSKTFQGKYPLKFTHLTPHLMQHKNLNIISRQL
jgi:hypothetical protein